MAFEIQQTLWMQMFNVQPFLSIHILCTPNQEINTLMRLFFPKFFLPLEKIYLKFNAAACCITFWLLVAIKRYIQCFSIRIISSGIMQRDVENNIRDFLEGSSFSNNDIVLLQTYCLLHPLAIFYERFNGYKITVFSQH